jgi:hypothetical protein
MKRGNTIFDPAEREMRLKDLANERDRGRRQQLTTALATEMLRADKRRAQRPTPPKRREEPPTPRPGPWQPLERLADLMKRKKNGGAP